MFARQNWFVGHDNKNTKDMLLLAAHVLMVDSAAEFDHDEPFWKRVVSSDYNHRIPYSTNLMLSLLMMPDGSVGCTLVVVIRSYLMMYPPPILVTPHLIMVGHDNPFLRFRGRRKVYFPHQREEEIVLYHTIPYHTTCCFTKKSYQCQYALAF
eukprot:scaffold6562_cov163-Amphora_coffeaeformis.AAC.7